MSLHPDEVVKSESIDIHHTIGRTKRIFLDTNFWNKLRDVELGRAKDQLSAVFSGNLHDRVRSSSIICPISAEVLDEVCRQVGDSKLAVARVIDRLSSNFAIAPYDERLQIETSVLMHKYAGNLDIHTSDELVWRRTSWVFGLQIPHWPELNLDKQTEMQMQEIFLQFMRGTKLQDIITRPDFHPPDFRPMLSEIAGILNDGNEKHKQELKKFGDSIDAEAFGVADLLMPYCQQTIERMRGVPFSDAENEAFVGSEIGRQHRNLFGLALQKKSNAKLLPTAFSQVMLHAARRWNKGQKVKPNDIYDFEHMSSALGYFDYIFCDGPTAHLAKQKNLNLETLFNCKITSNLEEAIEMLRDID